MSISIEIPSVGESISEVNIALWNKSDGDWVNKDEIIAEIESDKASFEIRAEEAGVLKILIPEDQSVAIGTKIAEIDTQAIPVKNAETKTTHLSEKAKSSNMQSNYAQNIPSLSAQKMIDEKKIDVSKIKGSGKGGRITKADVIENSDTASKQHSLVNKDKESIGNAKRDMKKEKLSFLRKTISRRLLSVKNDTAMLTTFNEVNMEPIMMLRKKYKEMFKEKYQINLGFMSFFSKAVTVAINDFPIINAQMDNQHILYPNYVDISIAVATPKGLVVPVIRDTHIKSIPEIEQEIFDLATKARANKLSIKEMKGGTFTITNGGVFGSLLSTPIINAPQSAILGMHNIVKRPMVNPSDQIIVLPMMYLALSYDHRIIDGKDSVSFLVRLKQLLEDPARLLLGI